MNGMHVMIYICSSILMILIFLVHISFLNKIESTKSVVENIVEEIRGEAGQALSLQSQHNSISSSVSTKNSTTRQVLVLSQARSGSSFIGALMSASRDAYYIYEPFKKTHGGKLDEELDKQTPEAINLVRESITGIMKCGKEAVAEATKVTCNWGKKVEKCVESRTRVIKTIRLRYSSVQSWIKDTDIKVKIFSL